MAMPIPKKTTLATYDCPAMMSLPVEKLAGLLVWWDEIACAVPVIRGDCTRNKADIQR